MTPCNYTTLLFKPNLRSGFFWFISGKFKPWVRGNRPSCRGTFLILIYTEINIYLKSWTKFLLNNCQPSKLEQKKLSSTVKATTHAPQPSPAPLTGEKKIERRNNRGWRNRSLSSLRSCPLPIIPLCLSRETKKQTKKNHAWSQVIRYPI